MLVENLEEEKLASQAKESSNSVRDSLRDSLLEEQSKPDDSFEDDNHLHNKEGNII